MEARLNVLPRSSPSHRCPSIFATTSRDRDRRAHPAYIIHAVYKKGLTQTYFFPLLQSTLSLRCARPDTVLVARPFQQEPSDVNGNRGAATPRAEYAGAAAGARAEYATSVSAPAAPAAAARGEGRGGWSSNENSARMPQPHTAAPGRPSFTGLSNNGQGSPKAKKGVFRRMLNRWRD